ncbi:hypothetical protein V8G54_013335 [Vigna mungo]|uniref:Uncharacterized protein n=1 Tax=Vigna mungo TaxID=3915 RepID=A0AAQ3S4U5_VIGMU
MIQPLNLTPAPTRTFAEIETLGPICSMKRRKTSFIFHVKHLFRIQLQDMMCESHKISIVFIRLGVLQLLLQCYYLLWCLSPKVLITIQVHINRNFGFLHNLFSFYLQLTFYNCNNAMGIVYSILD